ncbi:unnamed protein product [Sphenostylis stenocarpa]|uniref:Pectinesterase inhibitor domain-containing protein n=1 Tax=Sphenostylis stenocarpa TaxID=92480 RepID=A0AA86VSG6_9FABA|nr:unnamed protein product [Sphenostylis stenocarpa]
MAFIFIKTLFLFVSFSGLILHAHAHTARSPQARVWSLCKYTTNPVVCYKTIIPYAIGVKKFNYYQALEVEILATRDLVMNTTNLISVLLANPGNSKDLKDSLQTCFEQYDNIKDSIKESLNLVAQRNVIEMRFKFSAVLSYLAACTDEFPNSPIEKEGQDLFDLGGNCLDIMKAIEDRESRLRPGASPVPTPIVVTPPSAPSPCQNVIGPCS